MSRFAMAIDTRRCVGCQDCVVACKTENGVPEGYCRDWITEEVHAHFPRCNWKFARSAAIIATIRPA